MIHSENRKMPRHSSSFVRSANCPWKVRLATRMGAAALELALVLPFLLLVAFGACDFGRIVHVAVSISNATRAGAEYASLHGFTDFTKENWRNRVEETVRSELEMTPAINADEIDINVSDEVDDDGLPVITVQVAHTFETVVAWPALPRSTALERSFTMRRVR